MAKIGGVYNFNFEGFDFFGLCCNRSKNLGDLVGFVKNVNELSSKSNYIEVNEVVSYMHLLR